MAAVATEPVKDEEDVKQSVEVANNEENAESVTLYNKLFWYFQPLYSVYIRIKLSTNYASNVFGALEKITFALLSLLERGDSSNEDEEKEDHDTLDPVLDSLFRVWFQAHKNLRQSIYYIENLYEEIVPLIPGREPPFSNMDVENMPIRILCFYATVHMLCRLPFHTKRFIRSILRRIKSFILKPTEPLTVEF